MPTDYNRPTNQELIGMTPSQILDIFGGAGKEYEKYIPQYNRERENLARTDTQFSLKNIGIASGEMKAGSGLAENKAIDQYSGAAREGTLQGFQKQLEGFYSDYASDVYSALGQLAQLEAFEGNSQYEQYEQLDQAQQASLSTPGGAGSTAGVAGAGGGIPQHIWEGLTPEQQQSYLDNVGGG